MTITLDLAAVPAALLAVLGPDDQPAEVAVRRVVELLVDHAQQGVYRPGSWERGWLRQVFGDEWTLRLEPGDPYNRLGVGADDPLGRRVFQRPRKAATS